MKKHNLRILSLVLAVAMIVSSMGLTAFADGASGKWTDVVTAEDCRWFTDNVYGETTVTKSFNISTPTQLASLAYMVNYGYYNEFVGSQLYPDFDGYAFTIDNDLDMSAHEWVPIGTQEHPFSGTIVGKYIIANNAYTKLTDLTITTASQTDGNYGLVGYYKGTNTVDNMGIRNLAIEGSISITSGSSNAGAFAGKLVGEKISFFNLTSNMTINSSAVGQENIGGLAGDAEELSVKTCRNDSEITVTNGGAVAAGGFVGAAKKLTVIGIPAGLSGNYADLNVEAINAKVGGIAGTLYDPNGYMDFSSEEDTVNDSAAYVMSLGNITVESHSSAAAGGFIGYSGTGFEIDGAIFIRRVAVTGECSCCVGGILGLQEENSATTISNCKFTTKVVAKDNKNKTVVSESTEGMSGASLISGDVEGASYVGGICGYADNLNVYASYAGNDPSNTSSVLAEVYARSTVSHSGYAGGIAGFVAEGSVGPTPASAVEIYKLALNADGIFCVGGVIGRAILDTDFNAKLNGSEDTIAYNVNATATEIAGGVIGYCYIDGNIGLVSNEIKLNVKNTTDAAIGGFTGFMAHAGNITATFPSMSVKAEGISSSCVGGFSGINQNTGIIELTDGTDDGKALISLSFSGDDSDVGGLFGDNSQDYEDTTLLVTDTRTVITTPKKGNLNDIGGVAGYNSADFDGNWSRTDASAATSILFNDIDINANQENSSIGGIIGYQFGNTFCGVEANNVQLTARGSGNRVGGIMGETLFPVNDTALIDVAIRVYGEDQIAGGAIGDYNSLNESPRNISLRGSIQVSADDSVIGAYIGRNNCNLNDLSLADQFEISIIKADNTYVGGLIGENNEKLDVAYTTTKISINPTNLSSLSGFTVGGVVGHNTGSGSISNAFRTTDMTYDVDGTIGGTSYIGGLVGENSGSIEKSYVDCNINAGGMGNLCIGGFVGNQVAGSIANCYTADKAISSTADDTILGGFMGRYASGSVDYSYSAMSVSGAATDRAGGFFAFFDNADRTLASFRNSLYIQEQDVINSGLKTAATGTYLEFEQALDALRSIAPASLADSGTGVTSFAAHTSNTWDFTNTWCYEDEESSTRYIYPALSENHSRETSIMDIIWYTDDPDAASFHITNEAEFSGFAALVNGEVKGMGAVDFSGKTVYVDNDIIIKNANWTPIGNNPATPFAGTFDGQGNLLSDLSMSLPASSLGLFGYTEPEAVVSNFKLTVLGVESTSGYASAVVSTNYGSIEDVDVALKADASISGRVAGGAVAMNYGSIDNVSVTLRDGAEIAATKDAGGVVGYNANHATVGTVSVTGKNASIKGENAGGIVGRAVFLSGGSFTAATNVIGDVYAGGAVGYLTGPATDVALDGTGSVISSPYHAGGFAGACDYTDMDETVDISGISVTGPTVKVEGATTDAFAGGFTASVTNAAMEGCAVSSVTVVSKNNASDIYAGGIAGSAHDSIATGFALTGVNITADGVKDVYAGGAFGFFESTHTDKTYKLRASDTVGIFEGLDRSSLTDVTVSATAPVAADATTGYLADTFAFVGGLAGRVNAGSIYNSTANSVTAQVTGYQNIYAGGAAGLLEHSYLVNNDLGVTVKAANGLTVKAGGAAGEIAYSTARFNTVRSVAPLTVGEAVGISKAPVLCAGGFAGEITNTAADTVADNDAAVDISFTNTHINSIMYAGGFVGLSGYNMENIEIRDCSAASTLSLVSEVEGTPVGSESYVGGFAGQAYCGTINSCFAKSDVSENTGAKARSGGFAGSVHEKATVSNCYAVSSMVKSHGNSSFTGGFAGDSRGTIDAVYTVCGDLTADTVYVDAMVGQLHDNAVLTNAYTEGLAEGTLLAGFDFTSDSPVWTYVSGVNGNRPVLTAFESATASPDLMYLYTQTLDHFAVKSLNELHTVGALFNDTGIYTLFSDGRVPADHMHVELAADITCDNARLWKVSVPDYAVFDGCGHTIRNYKPAFAKFVSNGFFAVNDGTITDVTFDDASVTATDVAGVVAAKNGATGTIDTVIVLSSKLDALSCAGVITGENAGTVTKAAIFGVYRQAPVSGSFAFGGIAGRNSGLITDSLCGGDLRVSSCVMNLGGIAGECTGTIKNCMTASGSLIAGVTGATKKGNVGGIAGFVRGGYIKDCIALSQIALSDTDGKNDYADMSARAYVGAYQSSTVAGYYDSQLTRVADLKATKKSTDFFLGNQVISNTSFTAQPGMYPVLTWLAGTDMGDISTVAFVFGTGEGSAPDRIDTITDAFTINAADGVTITPGPVISTGGQNYRLIASTGELYLGAGNLTRTVIFSAGVPIKPEPGPGPSGPVAPSTGGGGGGGGIVGSTVIVYVDGEPYSIGVETVDTVTYTVTVDDKMLTSYIRSASTGSEIIIPLSAEYEKVKAVFNLQNVSDAAKKDMDITVNSGDISITIPADAIDTEAVRAAFGEKEMNEIPVFVAFTRLSDDEKAELERQTGKTIVGTPVSFRVAAGEENEVFEINTFKGWTVRTLPAKKSEAVTTGVEITGGKAYHKPTNGRKIYSMTNSVYAYVLNEVSLKDADGKWYERGADEMASRLIISGYADGSFRGENLITRAEFASIAVQALGLKPDGDGTVFTDVKSTDWFCGAVGKAYEIGLVSGKGEGRFDPAANITRQEAMVIIEKMARLMELTSTPAELDSYEDAADIAVWARSAVQFDVGAEIISGSNGMLRPTDTIKRSETAASILLLLRKSELVDDRTQ